jgi:hypothetical protein
MDELKPVFGTERTDDHIINVGIQKDYRLMRLSSYIE